MASATLLEYGSFCLQTGLAPSQLPSSTVLPPSNGNRPRRSVKDTFPARPLLVARAPWTNWRTPNLPRQPNYDARWRTWCTLAKAWNLQPLPITKDLVHPVGASLKAGGYKSADLYYTTGRCPVRRAGSRVCSRIMLQTEATESGLAPGRKKNEPRERKQQRGKRNLPVQFGCACNSVV
eukprot:3995441-Amphidinium_carterae.3